MPATYIFLLLISILLLVILGIVVYFKSQLQKKQRAYENEIANLKKSLAATTVEAQKHAETLIAIEHTNEIQKYAGMVVSQMDRAVVIINPQRNIVFFNDHAKQYLELNAALGMPYKDVVHIQSGGSLITDTVVDAALSGQEQFLPDNAEITSHHGSFPIRGSIHPLKNGQIVDAVVLIFEDISKHVAQVKEEQAFFSAAAHELRTPLTIIRMTVSLLREKFTSLPKEKIEEHLRRTDETTERLVRLVNEFLDIARIDQGRVELHNEKFDIIALTDEVIKNFALLAKQHNLFVNHEAHVEQRMVYGDKAKSAEVLSNLISNSIKYTKQGGLTVTHSISDSTMSTNVTDTGMGISKESQRLLFKRFGQIGKSDQLVPSNSTGLGLYISKRLAHLMRGNVALVSSEPGKGSTFTFTLPLS